MPLDRHIFVTERFARAAALASGDKQHTWRQLRATSVARLDCQRSLRRSTADGCSPASQCSAAGAAAAAATAADAAAADAAAGSAGLESAFGQLPVSLHALYAQLLLPSPLLLHLELHQTLLSATHRC